MVDWDGDGDASVAGENLDEIESGRVEFDSFRSETSNDQTSELDAAVAIPACRPASAVRREGVQRRKTDHSSSNFHPSLGTMTAFPPSTTCILRLTPSVMSALLTGPTSFSSSTTSSFDPSPKHIVSNRRYHARLMMYHVAPATRGSARSPLMTWSCSLGAGRLGSSS